MKGYDLRIRLQKIQSATMCRHHHDDEHYSVIHLVSPRAFREAMCRRQHVLIVDETASTDVPPIEQDTHLPRPAVGSRLGASCRRGMHTVVLLCYCVKYIISHQRFGRPSARRPPFGRLEARLWAVRTPIGSLIRNRLDLCSSLCSLWWL